MPLNCTASWSLPSRIHQSSSLMHASIVGLNSIFELLVVLRVTPFDNKAVGCEIKIDILETLAARHPLQQSHALPLYHHLTVVESCVPTLEIFSQIAQSAHAVNLPFHPTSSKTPYDWSYRQARRCAFPSVFRLSYLFPSNPLLTWLYRLYLNRGKKWMRRLHYSITIYR